MFSTSANDHCLGAQLGECLYLFIACVFMCVLKSVQMNMCSDFHACHPSGQLSAWLFRNSFPHYDPGLANEACLAGQGAPWVCCSQLSAPGLEACTTTAGILRGICRSNLHPYAYLAATVSRVSPNLDYPFSGAQKPLTSLCFFSLSQIYSIMFMAPTLFSCPSFQFNLPCIYIPSKFAFCRKVRVFIICSPLTCLFLAPHL